MALYYYYIMLCFVKAALLKMNQQGDKEQGSLLYVAMHHRDATAVHVIVSCWINFLTTMPTNGTNSKNCMS